MADYISTYSGIHFYPLAPVSEDILIEDIAHALSLICRGNGHVSTFFSVAQHCINCAREAQLCGLPKRICLACLLHDASECYFSDVPRPFKKELPNYIEREEELLSLIYTKFLGKDLNKEERKQVKDIDDRMLAYDLRELLSEETVPMPDIHIELSYAPRSFGSVEQEYLDLFQKLH